MRRPKVLIAHAIPAQFDKGTLKKHHFSSMKTRRSDKIDCGQMDLSDGNISGKAGKNLEILVKFNFSLHNCTIRQLGRQANLDKTFETLKTDVRFVSKTLMHRLTSIGTLHSPDVTSVSRFIFHLSDYAV